MFRSETLQSHPMMICTLMTVFLVAFHCINVGREEDDVPIFSSLSAIRMQNKTHRPTSGGEAAVRRPVAK